MTKALILFFLIMVIMFLIGFLVGYTVGRLRQHNICLGNIENSTIDRIGYK